MESFYPPFVAGIDLPHQGVVDSYNLCNDNSYTGKIFILKQLSAVQQNAFDNVNMVPSYPFMSHLATQLGYSAGEFQALQLIVLAAFGVVN